MSKIANLFSSLPQNISKTIQGSASVGNKGVNRLINGTQQQVGEYIIFRGGIKHLITEIFFRDKINAYLDAIKKGELEKAITVYKQVPKVLQQTFHEYAGLDSLFIKGKGAKHCDNISQFRQTVSDKLTSLKTILFKQTSPKLKDTIENATDVKSQIV